MFFWDKHKTITNCYEMIARSVCEKYQLTQMLFIQDSIKNDKQQKEHWKEP